MSGRSLAVVCAGGKDVALAPRSRFTSCVFALRPDLLARTALSVMAVVIVPGVVAEITARDDVLELDGERTLTALVSVAFMLGAATAAVAWAFRQHPIERASLGLAAVLVVLAVQEWTDLHLSLERALGVRWELVYAPLAAVGAACGLATLRSMRGALERRLMTGGALLFVLAHALGQRPFVGPELIDDTLLGVEEILDMAAALLIWLSFAYAAEELEKHAAAPHEPQQPSN